MYKIQCVSLYWFYYTVIFPFTKANTFCFEFLNTSSYCRLIILERIKFWYVHLFAKITENFACWNTIEQTKLTNWEKSIICQLTCEVNNAYLVSVTVEERQGVNILRHLPRYIQILIQDKLCPSRQITTNNNDNELKFQLTFGKISVI